MTTVSLTQGQRARLIFGLINNSTNNLGQPASITVTVTVRLYQGSALGIHGSLEAEYTPITAVLPIGPTTWQLDIHTQALSTGGQWGYEGYKDIDIILTLPDGKQVSQGWQDPLKLLPPYVTPVYDVQFGALDIFQV